MLGGAHGSADRLVRAPGADPKPEAACLSPVIRAAESQAQACSAASRNAATIRTLRARLDDPFGLGARSAALGRTRRIISTGLAPLDAALPAGGLPAAAIVELLFRAPGTGAITLALHLAARVQRADQRTGWCDPGAPEFLHPIPRESFPARCILVVDAGGDFYPPAAAHLGLDPQRLIVLRLRRPREALWAVEQALRCAAVAAVVAPFRGLDDRDVRRLQLSAERGGALGLLLRPSCAPVRTFAAARILVERARLAADAVLCCAAGAGDPLGLLRLTVLKVRDGFPSAPLTVDLHQLTVDPHHETGDVSLHPISVDGSAAQTGARRTG